MADPLYTEELLSRATLTLAAHRRQHGGGIDMATFAAALYAQHIGLVDLTRRQALVDERVYGSALERTHTAEQRLSQVINHHLPAASVWASLTRAA